MFTKKGLKPHFLLLGFCLATLLFFVWCGQACASTLSRAPNNLGLVGYWSFNEGTGTVAGDYSGYKNAGSISGTGAVWTDGKFGKALNFANGTLGMEVDSAAKVISTGSFTISAWVKFSAGYNTESAEEFVFRMGDASSDNDIIMSFGSGTSGGTSGAANIIHYNTSGWVSAPSNKRSWDANTWYHIVGTFSTTNGSVIYVNGISDGTNSDTVARGPNHSTLLAIGAAESNGLHLFLGTIDDVRIYNRELSAAEVQALYKSSSSKINTSQNKTVGNLDNGLVGQWSFDGKDISGTTAYDRYGIYNGTITNATKTIGKIGQALNFDGNGDYVKLPMEFYSTVSGGDEITMSGWFKGSRIQSMIRLQPTGVVYITLGWGTTNPMAIISTDGGTGGIYIDGNVQDGKWHHVVLDWKRNTTNGFKIYVDGVVTNQRNSANNALPTLTSVNSGYIGSYVGTSEFTNGIVDDVRIYNRALSVSEIKQLYNLGLEKVNASQNTTGGTLDSGLVALWSFDGKDISGATVYDRSSSGNNGTITGATKTIGKIGQALNFDGDADYIDSTDTNFSSGTNPLTMAMWFKTKKSFSSVSYDIAFRYGNDSSTQMAIIGFGTNDGDGLTNAIICSQWGDSLGTSNLNDGKWHQVTCSYDGSLWYLYVDGAFINSKAMTTNITKVGTSRIGTNNLGSQYWDGQIDDVRVYNRALSAKEAKQLYLMGR